MRKWLASSAPLIAAALLLPGCGTRSNTAALTDTPEAKAGLARAVSAIDALRAVPKFEAPGRPIDARSLAGKRVFVIPIAETPAGKAIERAEQEAAAAVGLELTFYSNQGAVADWVKGMQTAVAQHYDLILLENAPDPRQLQPQIKAAKAAGIPVVVTHFYDTKMPAPPNCDGCATGVTSLVRAPLTAAASAMGNWMVADSKGKADALLVTINGLLPIPSMIEATEDSFKRNCPACKIKVVSIDISQLGGSAISAVSTALARDPNIDYINPMFDILIAPTLASAQAANRADKVTMVSYNGSEFALKDVADGTSHMKMDVAESPGWIGYANIDQVLRTLAGKAPATRTPPIRVFDATNIHEAGPKFDQGFGTTYADGFLKLWGVN